VCLREIFALSTILQKYLSWSSLAPSATSAYKFPSISFEFVSNLALLHYIIKNYQQFRRRLNHKVDEENLIHRISVSSQTVTWSGSIMRWNECWFLVDWFRVQKGFVTQMDGIHLRRTFSSWSVRCLPPPSRPPTIISYAASVDSGYSVLSLLKGGTK